MFLFLNIKGLPSCSAVYTCVCECSVLGATPDFVGAQLADTCTG